jgi:hypothetical protein
MDKRVPMNFKNENAELMITHDTKNKVKILSEGRFGYEVPGMILCCWIVRNIHLCMFQVAPVMISTH